MSCKGQECTILIFLKFNISSNMFHMNIYINLPSNIIVYMNFSYEYLYQSS